MKGHPGAGFRHGTYTGWSQHQQAGERPCDACFRAKQEYDKRRRSSSNRQIQNRQHARAQGRAARELKDRYPEEYKALYEKHKKLILKEDEASDGLSGAPG